MSRRRLQRHETREAIVAWAARIADFPRTAKFFDDNDTQLHSLLGKVTRRGRQTKVVLSSAGRH